VPLFETERLIARKLSHQDVPVLTAMLSEFRTEINASGLSVGIVALSWGVVVAPSMLYLGKYKIQELRNAGYFLPRR